MPVHHPDLPVGDLLLVHQLLRLVVERAFRAVERDAGTIDELGDLADALGNLEHVFGVSLADGLGVEAGLDLTGGGVARADVSSETRDGLVAGGGVADDVLTRAAHEGGAADGGLRWDRDGHGGGLARGGRAGSCGEGRERGRQRGSSKGWGVEDRQPPTKPHGNIIRE